MKILLTSLGMAAMIGLSGCGGSGSDNSVNVDATVKYKTSATYDLKDYIAPAENSINTYRELTYTNNAGKKSFKGEPDEVITSEKYDIQNNTIIVRDGSDAIDDVYVIKPDRIENKDDLNSTEIESFARFVDIGDYIVVSDHKTDNSEGISIERKIACKVVRNYNSKDFNNKRYDNVLQVVCKTTGLGSTSANGILIDYDYDADETVYLAKNIGEVYSESVSCEKVITTVNGKKTTNATCEKETRELISSNKI